MCSCVLRSFARLGALFPVLGAGFVLVYLFLAVLTVVVLASMSMSLSKMARRWLKSSLKMTPKWLLDGLMKPLRVILAICEAKVLKTMKGSSKIKHFV